MEKHPTASCIDTLIPVRDTLAVLSGKWKLQVIIAVGVGNHRFTALQQVIPGITPKVLAKELKELEKHQLLTRTVLDDYPVSISYHLTPYADTLNPLILAMKAWGLAHATRLAG